MIVTTTGGVEGQEIESYLGVVTGRSLVAVRVVKSLVAGVRDRIGARIVSGTFEPRRVGTYEREFGEARDGAMDDLQREAEAHGANAVIGVNLDYKTVGGGSMVMVTASGTAVRLRQAA